MEWEKEPSPKTELELEPTAGTGLRFRINWLRKERQAFPYTFSYLFTYVSHKYIFNIYYVLGNTIELDVIFMFLEPILLTS